MRRGPTPGARRIDHGRGAGCGVDAGNVIAAQRCVPDLAGGRGGDAIRPVTLRRLPGIDLSARRIDTSVDAGLAGEPEDAALVEGRRVEIGLLESLRQRKELHLFAFRIDARDRVQPGLGDPRRAVRPGDHAMRRRALAERHLLHLAGSRVENAERALVLRRVPDRAVGRGRDIVRMRALRDGEVADARLRARRRTKRKCGDHRRGNADHALSPSRAGFAPVFVIRQLRVCCRLPSSALPRLRRFAVPRPSRRRLVVLPSSRTARAS